MLLLYVFVAVLFFAMISMVKVYVPAERLLKPMVLFKVLPLVPNVPLTLKEFALGAALKEYTVPPEEFLSVAVTLVMLPTSVV